MIRKMGISWQLRLRMAERELFQTSDLVPLLAEDVPALVDLGRWRSRT